MSTKTTEVQVEQKVAPATKIITGIILSVIGVILGSLIITFIFFFVQ